MISLTHGFAEVHVPRTGGTSRHTAFQQARCFNALPFTDDKDNTVRDKGIGSWHWPAHALKSAIGPERWEKLFTFSFARDPRTVVLSTYFYRRDKLYPPNNNIIPKEVSFEEWILETVRKEPISGEAELGRHSRFWVCPESEKCLVDKIFNFDRLSEVWPEICDRVGIQVALPDKNGTGRNPVDEYYTPELESIVMRRFEMDFPILKQHGIEW